MNRIFITVALALACAVFSQTAPGPDRAELPQGTMIKVRLAEPVSSATAKVADLIHFEVEEDVKAGGAVIVPKGSKAQGFITEAMSSHLWRDGRLTISVSSISMPSGFRLPVYAFKTVTTEGKDATLAPGTELTASTELEVVITDDGSARTLPSTKPPTSDTPQDR